MKNIERINKKVVLVVLCFISVFTEPSLAQDKQRTSISENDLGLSKYDFLYASESPTQNIYIIKNGEIREAYK
jgi:hypothetical protein